MTQPTNSSFILLFFLLSCQVARTTLPDFSQEKHKITIQSVKGYYVNIDNTGGDTMIALSKKMIKTDISILKLKTWTALK